MNNQYKHLFETKFEQVIKELDRIHSEHRTGDSYFGTLSSDEALKEYDKILGLLDSIPGLTQDEIIKLKKIIEERIMNIPKVEVEKAKEYQEYISRKNEAFEVARSNYSKRSVFYRAIAKIKSTDPASLEKKQPPFGHSKIDEMNISEIESLYRKK